MGLVNCIDWVKEAADISGIKKVGTPGERFPQKPYAMVYARPGEYSSQSLATQFGLGTHNIIVQFHYPLENLEKNLPQVWQLTDSFVSVLRTKEYENGVHQVVSASYAFFADNEDGINEHGVLFDITLRSEDAA
ncbi:MAG: hypothetical protein AAF902_02055 [Chloroflexota bacterium]